MNDSKASQSAKIYTTPTATVLGPMTELTQGGGGSRSNIS